MTVPAGDTRSPQFTLPALAEWNYHVECIMRGLGHALNNRAAALSAIMELARDPEDDGSVTGSIMEAELQRVRELAAIVRAIGAPRGGSEAFAPSDAADEALSVLKMHADLRERSVKIEAKDAPPIRVPRWMFLRSIVALGGAACRDGGQRAPLRIVAAGEGDSLVVRVETTGAPGTSPYAAELARAMEGESLGATDRGIRIPTLAALRQREAR